MAEVKGKFITLAGALMCAYQNALSKADTVLFEKTQRHWNELDPEGWYDTKIFDEFMTAYSVASPSKETAIVTLGKNVYPAIKKTDGLPPHLSTPLDFIKFEAEGFMQNHRGADVIPRKILRDKDRDVLIEAPAPGYHSKLYVGVFLGILNMCGVANAKVEQTKAQERGDSTSEFHITW